MNESIKYQVFVNAPRKRYIPYSKKYDTKEEALQSLKIANDYKTCSMNGELLNYKIKEVIA